MEASFLMPTRIIHGAGVLAGIGSIAAAMCFRRVLIVTDMNITPQPFYAAARDALDKAGIHSEVYDGCGIDAHLEEVDEQAARVRAEDIEAIVGIGGGSALCVAKAIAIVAKNPPTFRDCAGIARFPNRALPMLLVPTTAGSGAEVSQFTLVKDDANGTKFVGGGPLSFPDVALLDPVVLTGIPSRLAAVSAIDALTHAVEAMFTEFATPLTDGLAATAISILIRAIPRAIATRTPEACADNLLGSAIANMACGNARLGLAHALSLPLEARCHAPHGIGVGVLLPHVLAFNAMVAPGKVRMMAQAMELDAGGDDVAVLARVLSALRQLFDEIGFPHHFDGLFEKPASLREIAEAALPGLYGAPLTEPVSETATIASPNIRRATLAEAEALYTACFI
ncbi:MAG: iron-containing alcohol dehydrogenase [Erythrobacter sp.]|jgi:alcohol dehydrogenase class IV